MMMDHPPLGPDYVPRSQGKRSEYQVMRDKVMHVTGVLDGQQGSTLTESQ